MGQAESQKNGHGVGQKPIQPSLTPRKPRLPPSSGGAGSGRELHERTAAWEEVGLGGGLQFTLVL